MHVLQVAASLPQITIVSAESRLQDLVSLTELEVLVEKLDATKNGADELSFVFTPHATYLCLHGPVNSISACLSFLFRLLLY